MERRGGSQRKNTRTIEVPNLLQVFLRFFTFRSEILKPIVAEIDFKAFPRYALGIEQGLHSRTRQF